ncbi:NAD(P)-dependent oxidoreductase [Pandoraea pnomenusa]|uniref:NAD(P)-dependent oxidoreductase n=1 Tax=Pandoraea pnomenusa TaxID=93220 RepID=UPI003340F6DE
MKVALIGITGRVGKRVAEELLARKHTVTGIARNPENVEPEQGLTVVEGNAADPASLAPLLADHDAVISAGRFVTMDAAKLIEAVKRAGVPRLLVVGGAGSLEIAPGKALIDTPDFPEAYKPEAGAGRVFLQVLRAEPKDSLLNWTFLSPSALFEPGERTGKFRLGGDALLVDANGKSWISMEDYAIALVDELEKNAHPRARFTVGY